jgi:uncharacterized protein (TIGR00369 family)
MGLFERHGNPLRDAWNLLHGKPGGDALLNLAIKVLIPYTGSLGARVLEVRPGFARVELVERRAVRNHLSCIHAVALANLVELAGNVGIMYALPDDARFIIGGMRLAYHRKARGRVVAEAHPPVPTSSEKQAFEVHVEVRDAKGELVCEGWLDTRVGPKKALAA